MKVVLVKPNYPTYFIVPPLGLGYIAASLKQAGIEPFIIDGVKEHLTEESILNRIENENPDWVGITCLSAFFDEVKSLSLKLKEKNYKVVIGGQHPTFMPYMTLIETKCDYVCCGEGEIAIRDLIIKGNNAGIEGIYSLNELKCEDTPIKKAEKYNNLDDIPFPDWEQMDPRTYEPAPVGMVAKKYPLGVMMSSRGCPFGCIYCSGGRFYDRKVRFRSPENVVEEMKLLINKYKVKEIQFMDDNMILKRSHIEGICNLILKEKLNITWSCPNGIRADCLDYELAKLMKKAGCYLATIGIESSNPQTLKNIKKGENIETITNAIYVAKKAGIIINGAFVLGLPGDTRETMRETINYAKKMPLDRAFFTIMDIIPGCELWENDKKKYNTFQRTTSFAKPSILPEGMTEKELIELQERAMHEFYFRPKIMFNIVKLIRFSQIQYILSRLLKFRLFDNIFDVFKKK